MKDLSEKKHWNIKSEISLKKLINNIEGADFSEINNETLLRELHNRYLQRAKTWTTLAKRYAIVDKLFQFALVFLLSLLIFLKLIEEFPLTNYFSEFYILTASVVIFSIHLNLKLYIKAELYRKGAETYSKLEKAAQYSLWIVENCGKFENMSLFLNECLQTEIQISLTL